MAAFIDPVADDVRNLLLCPQCLHVAIVVRVTLVTVGGSCDLNFGGLQKSRRILPPLCSTR